MRERDAAIADLNKKCIVLVFVFSNFNIYAFFLSAMPSSNNRNVFTDKSNAGISLLSLWMMADKASFSFFNIDKTNISKTFQLLDFLKQEGLSICPVDFGIVKGSTESCASYKSNCFLEEELGDILYPLWKGAESRGFSVFLSPFKRYLYCGLLWI